VSATAKQQLRRNVANDPYSNPTKTYSVPATTNEDGTLNIPVQPVMIIDATQEPIVPFNVPSGQTTQLRAVVTNTSTVTVPAGERWNILYIGVHLLSDATVGARALRVDFANAAGNLIDVGFPVASVASQNSTLEYGFGGGGSNGAVAKATVVAAAINAGVQATWPTMILVPGDTIRIWETNAVSAGDAITYVIRYQKLGL